MSLGLFPGCSPNMQLLADQRQGDAASPVARENIEPGREESVSPNLSRLLPAGRIVFVAHAPFLPRFHDPARFRDYPRSRGIRSAVPERGDLDGVASADIRHGDEPRDARCHGHWKRWQVLDYLYAD